MTFQNPKKNLRYQKDHMVEELRGTLKQKIYETMTTSKDLTPEIKQEYAENWLSVPVNKFNELHWI